jgi:hypothetical protein
MAVKWTCDFPGCAESSVQHKEWKRYQCIEQAWFWLLIAMPVIGNMFALLLTFDESAIHFCPKHAKALKGEPDAKIE